MRKLLAAVLVLTIGLVAVQTLRAEEAKADSKDKKITGVVIDQMCAKKMEAKEDPQKAAGGHDKACCLKCADSGFAIMADGKTTKLSADSSDKVKEYLSKDDAKTKVTIEGTTQDDGTLKVSSIAAAGEDAK